MVSALQNQGKPEKTGCPKAVPPTASKKHVNAGRLSLKREREEKKSVYYRQQHKWELVFVYTR